MLAINYKTIQVSSGEMLIETPYMFEINPAWLIVHKHGINEFLLANIRIINSIFIVLISTECVCLFACL